jgi:CTP:molybdopterin cytidylyltransferase MocA
VRRGIRLLARRRLRAVVVVVGRATGAGAVRGRAGRRGPRLETGMGSLRPGCAACRDAGAVVVALVDQPLVTPAVGGCAAHDAARRRPPSRLRGRPRNPVLLDRSGGGGGAAAARTRVPGVAARAPARVAAVDCTDVGAPDDVDTPSDLAGLQRRTAAPDPQREAPP